MNLPRLLPLAALLLATATSTPAVPAAPTAKPLDAAPGSPPAARVNGRAITGAELDRSLAADLFRAAEAMYELRMQGLERLVGPQLEADEAKARGLSVADLERAEIHDKVDDPAPAEVAAVSAMLKGKLPEDPARARAAVTASIRAQREQARRNEFLHELWLKAKVEILIEPPRAVVGFSPKDPSRGPADAPVTIIEFGDFACEVCASFDGTEKALERKHPGLIRFAYRQMPLSIHEHSREAAELSLCAHDQGKFWPMHDWLLADQDKLASDKVLAAAPGLGLDADAMRACFEAKAHADAVDADLALAHQLGVNTTPMVLVNGRLLVGDAAVNDLGKVVEDELRRAGK